MSGHSMQIVELRSELVAIPRLLPFPGYVFVRLGEQLQPEDKVAGVDMQQGVNWMVPVAEQLAVAPADMLAHLRVQIGEKVRSRQVLAQREGSTAGVCRSPVSGLVAGVDADHGQIVLREEIDPRPTPHVLSAMAHLHCPRSRLPGLIHRRAGESIRRGDILAGDFPGPILFSPISGTLHEINLKTGEIVIMPAREQLQLSAAAPGIVAQIIPRYGCWLQSQAATLPGRFRLGGQAYGRLQTIAPSCNRQVRAEQVTDAMSGQVIVLPFSLTGETLLRARAVGVSGIVAGGAHLSELLPVAGVSCYSQAVVAELPGISVLLLAGFGDLMIDQTLFSWLQSQSGRPALISDQRPELLVFS